ncbi:MAG: M28 family peptidase [Saprospiraceae bacterium]
MFVFLFRQMIIRFYLIILTFLLFSKLSISQYYNGITRPDFAKKTVVDSLSQLTTAIDQTEMSTILDVLTSDSCAGRELGSIGIDIAANFIASKFQQYGIQKIGDNNSYFQHVGFSWVNWENTSFTANDTEFKLLWDYVAVPTENNDLEINAKEIVFCGYGIDDPNYNDYENTSVKGKVILIYNGEPTKADGTSWITNSQFQSDWSTNFNKKIEAAKKHEVALILVIEEKFKQLVDLKRSQLISPTFLLDSEEYLTSNTPNVAYMSSSTSSHVIGTALKKVIQARNRIKKKGRAHSFSFNTKLEISQKKNIKAISGKNIMAYFEGTDKKEEIVIVSAHYDHIGKKNEDIFNGADDNGSGTTAVIQIAKALQVARDKGIKPRRTILCLLVTGEEKGLLGSNYYVNNPRLDLNKTTVDINIDMVGRIDKKYSEDSAYLYVIGSDRLSSDLHRINEEVNSKYSQLILDYVYNAENDPNRYYYRSDHYNFAEKRIPAIFFFNGTHEDYHRITDDKIKINLPILEKRTKHIFLLTWELANIPKRIIVDK